MDERPRLLLSIDFEDWHQLVHRRLGLSDWDRPYDALERETAALLDLLDEIGARATFFLLGMAVANQRVHEQTRDDFRADVEHAIELIEDVTGRRPVAYRAPAFSINRRTPWA